MATITLDKLTKVYPTGVRAVSDLSIEVGEGEFMVFVGPSGCGKTTALRMVAGLEDITSGSVYIGTRRMNEVSAKDHDIAMVFQNYALYPHMTVAANIGFALKMRKLDKAEIKRKVDEAAEILGLTEVLGLRPGQLSGGQRQRVAMGRAIVREPAAFLMDEPLSNLDAKLRVQMRAEVSRIQRHIGVATLYVTHDQTEAMTMGDRVGVLHGGVLEQCAPPQELYDRPVNLFVAGFIGSPAMNLYECQLVESEGNVSVKIGDQLLSLDPAQLTARPGLLAYKGRNLVVGIRPEDLSHLRPQGEPARGATLHAKVELVEALGSELVVHFSTEGRRVLAEGVSDAPGGSDLPEPVLGGRNGRTAAGIARLGPRTTVAVGDDVALAVDTNRLHFYDIDSSQAIWQ